MQPEALRKRRNLAIFLDDVADSDGVDKEFLKSMFLKDGHHRLWSIFLIVHHLFDSSIPYLRTILLNVQIFYLTNSPRSVSSLCTFMHQCFPGHGQTVMKIYSKLMDTNFNYLILDLHPRTNNRLRLKSKIFPDEGPTEVYLLE